LAAVRNYQTHHSKQGLGVAWVLDLFSVYHCCCGGWCHRIVQVPQGWQEREIVGGGGRTCIPRNELSKFKVLN